ncbi:peptidase T [Paratissierella segnis]|uniref:Peptidase T n=1 Tax=Paratissierella segnis TaxID=2763679 RepID=A0A926IL39_9FIRM|nr:peptidase T [Paratissierella segnis]MBC8588283.1 peptidase T [Paratissierella segnis]
MENLVNRFLNYVKFETTSDGNSTSVPSTKNQKEFAKILVKELKEIGLKEVSVDNNGYVMATLPTNMVKDVPTIGFVAHMDTSPDMSGKDVNPKIIKDYKGGDITLNAEKNIVLRTADFPELNDYIGHDLITTDGTTLLGADDKAGIAEIITAMEYLIQNPEIPHGKIKIGFTPDEEIGRGADFFDVEKFGADFAYTVDGGSIGELEYENFNAASARIVIQGRNVHPGTAKDKMINSMLIATELNNLLPVNEKPEYTEGYDGFYHLTGFNGDVESTTMNYIIRDHSMEKFEAKKKNLEKIVDFLNYKYDDKISLEINDSYYNMKEKIEPVIYIVDMAKEAMMDIGIKPIIQPIRGGTDGARLSYEGLPCPNLFTGGLNFHGKYEYISIQGMELAVKTILKIIEKVQELPIHNSQFTVHN